MHEPQVVYEPEDWPRLVREDRHDELRQWLRAHGIDPADVSVDEEITIELMTLGGDRAIHYTAFLRDADGHFYRDESTDGPAQEPRFVPLAVDPPPQWRTSEETTR
ncbi:hypothetical protein [Streptomyces venezuelae]|uniref:hypothetical protein n=1 Tax=Streptomyces venezuelae TaxID=54571 RepID=UPI0036672080